MSSRAVPFDSIAPSYAKVSESWASIYNQIGKLITPLVRGKVVLDIGNGGHFPYDTNLPARVIALDISQEMLNRIQNPRVEKIIGDARDLSGIEDASVDVVLFFLSIHHMNGRNLKETYEVLDRVLSSAERKLKKGGKLIIAEPTLKNFLFLTEKIFFQALSWFLNSKKVGMIFFHHPDILAAHLSKIFKSAPEKHFLPIRGWVDPMGGSFPGVFKIPGWSCPTRYYLFIADKP